MRIPAIISLIISIIFLSLNSSAQCKTDLERSNIKGNVKQIKTTGTYKQNGNDDLTYIEISDYDKNGNATGYSFAHKNDNMKPTKTEFEFNAQGYKVKEIRYDLNNKVRNTLTYTYDDKGNVIESRYHIKNNQLDSYTRYSYNDNCDIIEYHTFYSDSSSWLWYKYKYKKGLLIEVLDVDRKSFDWYDYDDRGNVTERIVLREDGVVTDEWTYTYEYDEHDNWIIKTSYKNGSMYWEDRRDIVYY